MPNESDISASLGLDSPVYAQVVPGLLHLLHRGIDSAKVKLRIREWRHQRTLAGLPHESDEETFVRHTYLAALSRLLARSFLGTMARISNPRQLREVLVGDFFSERGLDNLAEDDFFTWPVAPELAQDGLKVLAPLAEAVRGLGPADLGQSPLVAVRKDLGNPSPATSHPKPGPGQTILHAESRAGGSLFYTVKSMAEGLLEQGLDEFDTLLLVLDRVAATDPDPLAVTLSRTNFLFALGNMVAGPHPPVSLPVYLSRNRMLEEDETIPEGSLHDARTFLIGAPGLEFSLPGRVADDLRLLEWLTSRLPNYLNGAAMRRISQGNDDATEAVLIAFHNYLLAPKPRTPVPEPLTPEEAAVMEQTTAKLVRLYLEEEDLFWLFLLKNVAASRCLSRRKFDLTILG